MMLQTNATSDLLLNLLKQKDIKLKISEFDEKTEGYVYMDEGALHNFLCGSAQVVKYLQQHATEDNIYEMELFRTKGGKWCLSRRYRDYDVPFM